MNYSVIIKRHNGSYHALIPTLPDISAEGVSRDDALLKAKQAAETYLAEVEVVSIEVGGDNEEVLRPGSPQAVLQAAGKFVGDEEAMLQHIEEIYAERRRQREMVENEDLVLTNEG